MLAHYFPHPNQSQSLFISNKYYKAHVQMKWKSWTDVMQFQSLDEKTNENVTQSNDKSQDEVKYDLMIMLVNENQQTIINFESLDSVIETFNPDEFVLLVNTTTPQQSWQHEETIIEKCNNFIEIVKEDLWKVNKVRPAWSRGALLNNQEEANESGIFSILDRMETTRWTGMVNVKNDLPSDKISQTPNQPLISKETAQLQQTKIKNQPAQIQGTPQQNSTNLHVNKSVNRKDSSDEEQVDDKKIQEQMQEFQSMMGQMMAFKMQSAGMKDQERKQRAEELFTKMFKGMGFE